MTAARLIVLAGIGACHLLSQTPTFHTGVSNLRIEVFVSNYNQPIEGLRSTDFAVRDEGEVCPIVSFAAENLPLDLVLMLDVSGTMHTELRRLERDANRAIEQMKPGDKVAIMSFTDDTELDLPFTSDTAALTKTIKRLSRGPREGTTRNGSAMLAAGRLLAQTNRETDTGSPRRRAILIITDNLAQEPMQDETIIRALSTVDVVFSGIVVPVSRGRSRTVAVRDKPSDRYYTLANVFHIAKVMGGDAYLSKGTTIPEMLARLRQRYTLWCRSAVTGSPGTFRRLSVELNQDAGIRYPQAEIRAPEGYYVRGK